MALHGYLAPAHALLGMSLHTAYWLCVLKTWALSGSAQPFLAVWPQHMPYSLPAAWREPAHSPVAVHVSGLWLSTALWLFAPAHAMLVMSLHTAHWLCKFYFLWLSSAQLSGCLTPAHAVLGVSLHTPHWL